MSDPRKKVINKQLSLSYVEQSMKIISAPQEAPVVIYPGPKSHLADMSKADIEIATRLQRLRKSSTEIPTEEEMASRLARLKGLPSDHYSKNSNVAFILPDNRTQAEQSDDLLQQVMEEVQLDSQAPKADDEIAARLAKLQGEEFKSGPPIGFGKPTPLGFDDQHQLTGSLGAAPLGFSHHVTGGLDLDEVNKLMKATENEMAEATHSLEALKKDPDIAEALAKAVKKKDKKEKKVKPHKEKQKKKKDKKEKDKMVKALGVSGSISSSGEKYSHSDDSDSDFEKKHKKTTKKNKKEKKEIDRIVNLYTSKAMKPKKSKKLGESSSSSELESSSEEYSTSESDKKSSSN